MRPRLLLRTHYQADEPRLLISAVTRCSSPTAGRSEDTVAAALKEWARNNNYTVSTPGALYAIDNARHLGLLNKSNRWTASGFAFAFLDRLVPPQVGSQSLQLTSVEERLYLKLYLAGAGALLIMFARWLLERGSATDEQLRIKSVIEQLLTQALDEYLGLATEVRDRAEIRRERDRLSRADYASSTKRHKRYPLLTTMFRLRLLDESYGDEGAAPIRPDAEGRLTALARAVPNIDVLERLIRANKLQETLDVEMGEYARRDLPKIDEPLSLLLRAYAFSMQSGLQACPLIFLDDVLGAFIPASPTARSPAAEQLLESVHREQPGEVRFHVDRRGKRAFVLLSNRAQEYLKNKYR